MTMTTTRPIRPRKEVSLSIRVSAAARDALVEEAARRDVPISQVVREKLQACMLDALVSRDAPAA